MSYSVCFALAVLLFVVEVESRACSVTFGTFSGPGLVAKSDDPVWLCRLLEMWGWSPASNIPTLLGGVGSGVGFGLR